MKTPHKYAAILSAIAAGESIQWRITEGATWQAQRIAMTLEEIAQETFEPSCYRIAPSTVVVGGKEIVRPMSVAPTAGTPYWYGYAGSPNLVALERGCVLDSVYTNLEPQ